MKVDPKRDLTGVIIDMEDDIHRAIRLAETSVTLIEEDHLDAFYSVSETLVEVLNNTRNAWRRASSWRTRANLR